MTEGIESAQLRAFNQTFALVTYGPDAKITGANFNFLRLTGYNSEELLGADYRKFCSDSYGRERLAAMWNAIAEGEVLEDVSLYVTRDGREFWLRSHFAPTRDEHGTLLSILQIGEDVTERELRDAEERGQIEAIMSSQAVVHLSLEGEILSANEIFLEGFGYEESEIVGEHHSMLIDSDERESAGYAQLWSSLKEGRHVSGEFRRVNKDGSDVWLQSRCNPIRDQAGRLVKVIESSTFITDEIALRADTQWQLAAINKSNAVISFDIHGTILDANQIFLDAVGYELEDIRGRHHRMFVDTAYAHSTEYNLFWEDLRKGRPCAGQYLRVGKDLREVWLQATYNPIFDAKGRVVKIVKFASVVTGEKLLQAEHQGQIAAINKAQCVISFKTDGTVIDANENFLSTMGYRYGEVRGRHHAMFCEKSHIESAEYEIFWRDLAEGRHRSGEYKRLAKDGSEIWLQATYNPIRDVNGRVFRVVKYATDITSDKLLQAHYQGQIEAINRSQNVAVFGLDGIAQEMNSNFLETLGYDREEIVGQHHSMLLERDVREGSDYSDFWDTLRAGRHLSGMYKRIGKNGKEVWIQASYNPILDPDGKPVKIVEFAADVSSDVALAQAFEEARRQTQMDAATSLPNRSKLTSFMKANLADGSGTMAVFYMDLDRFKTINDTHGHHVGDRVLGEVADRLRRNMRGDQLAARVGGDEFVIAAPGMTIEAIEGFCERLYQAIAHPITHDDGEIRVGLSIGIAMSPTDGSTVDDLLRAADAALYRSKQEGRGVYSFYSSELNERIDEQRKLLEEMKHSLASGDFYLEYQPRFETGNCTIRSVEALVRWAHPERGRISPAEFIPLAERSGLIISMGEWILDTACRAAVEWDGIGVSVNVSPVQFRDVDFIAKLSAVLKASGLRPELLEIEVTEGLLLDDADRAVKILDDVKKLGVRLAMDDFGTGYSSLNYLRNYPFDVIKIDRSFVSDLTCDKSGRPIIRAILSLGEALGLAVTAEGVETDEQLTLLSADRCAEVQGFLLSKPVGTDEIAELVREQIASADRDEDPGAVAA